MAGMTTAAAIMWGSIIAAGTAATVGGIQTSQAHQEAKKQRSMAEGMADAQRQANEKMESAPGIAQEAAKALTKRKRAAMTDTVYTSPLGIAGEAGIARKTLLGQ